MQQPVVQQPVGQKALDPVEDWITGRGHAHMAMFGLTCLSTLFFILYLVGASIFNAAVSKYDSSFTGLDPFYYIPPLLCWLLTACTLFLSRNESTGCIFLCGMPFMHLLNALLMVIIYFIFGIVAAIYDKDTVCGLIQPGEVRDDCIAIGDSMGLMAAMIWLLVFSSILMTIASCVRKSMIVSAQQQVQAVQMVVMVPAQGQAANTQGQPQQQQQTMQPQGTDVEAGVAVANPERSTSWGFEDLNPFLPQKFNVAN